MKIEDLIRVRALIGIQRWDEALTEINRQLATAPGDAQLLSDKALVLLALQRFGEALDAAERALAVRPDAVTTMLLRAEALRCLGRRRQALEAAEEVAGRAPGNEMVRISLARCQLLARRRAEAEETAAAVVATNPTSVDGWIALGETRLGRNPRGALDAFRRALAIDPMSTAATNGLGVAYEQMGSRRDAALMYTQASRLDPREATPRQNLERLAAGLLGLIGIAVVVASQTLRDKPILTALAVLGVLGALALPILILVRRKLLADLPPEAQAYVRSQRRARRRALRDPRNWPEFVRTNRRLVVAALGIAVVFAALVAFGPTTQRPERRPGFDFSPEDFQLPTTVLQNTGANVVLRCSDGSTVPLRPGVDIFECEDFTIVSAPPPVRPAPPTSVGPR